MLARLSTPPSNPPQDPGAPAPARFSDWEAAQANLARVRERVPDAVFHHLTTLLGQSPDPDSALNLFERFTVVETAPEVLRLMQRHPFLVHYAQVVFGRSHWLGETLLQNPDLFHALERDRNLERSQSREDYAEHFARFRSRSFETDISTLLARFKRREYVRIMLRDVLAIATLAETTAEIAALSDILIEEALREIESVLRKRFGAPQCQDAAGRTMEAAFTVLSMGKLGGRELNYSSDIDLLFLYGDGERPPGSEISNREYFIRLAQNLTEVLTRVTREGPVFRIDLRLRPQGREGEPAVALRHALEYYAGRAQDWELQALIKARHSAGDVALAREFLRSVQPFVYRPEVNFAAIETALKTREKIGSRRRQAAGRAIGGQGLDVKLDPGGIRDIEFLVQCLQRVYGGAEPWLRSSGTLFSLQKLHDKMHLSGKDFHELHSAYEYLRKVEHHLQLRRGQQTHRLPADEAELAVLCRAVESRSAQVPAPDDFLDALRRRMGAVAEIYQRIVHRQQQQQGSELEFFLRPLESGREYTIERILERLAAEAPAIHEIVTRRDLSAHTRRNLHRFLSAAMTSGERYAALLRSSEALERALALFGASDFLSEILVRHTEEIAALDTIRPRLEGGELFERAAEMQGLDAVFRYLGASGAPYGEKMALLRRHYRHRMLLAGARDIMAPRPVYEALEETSLAAEDAVAAALEIAGRPAGLAVLALGRLGTREFDIASDADLLFVRDEQADPLATRRAAEQIIEILAAYTRDGTVFPVDPRLRPHGSEGELVVTPAILAAYFAQEAQPWEALTYTKLRFLAGATDTGLEAVRAVRRGTHRFAEDPGFVPALREMRAKLEKSDRGNFKTGPGGFYDIDFIATALLVRHGLDSTHGNVRERLHGLASRGLLSDNDCATLDYAAELLRTVEHVIRLVLGRARKSLPATEHARQVTEGLAVRTLGREFPRGLEPELERLTTGVREVFDRVLR